MSRTLPTPQAPRRLRGRPEAGHFNLRNQHHWHDRAGAAVDLWLRHDGCWSVPSRPLRVSDLGAGSGLVGVLLSDRAKYPIAYRGYDLLPQSSLITWLDVRDGLPLGQVDLVVCLGLLEYLPPEDPIISRLAQHARFAVVSYVGFDTESTAVHRRWKLRKRRALQWTRHQTSEAFYAAFLSAGFSSVASVHGSAGTGLWLWQAT